MKDAQIPELVALLMESETLGDCEPTRPAGATCLGMARLEQLATAAAASGAAEQEHLDSCRRCRLRLDAFREERQAVTPRSRNRPVFMAAAGLAIAMSGLAIWQELRIGGAADPESTQVPIAPADVGALLGAGCELTICVETGPVTEAPGSRRVQVELIAEEDCVAVAMVGAWDESCQCLEWQLHRWQDSAGEDSIHSRLGGGVPRALELEMEGGSDAEHALLILTAREAASLPADADAARRIVECFDETSRSTSQLQTCVSDQVCAAQQSFVVR